MYDANLFTKDFTERLPGLVEFYARMTPRLIALVQSLGLVAGGQMGTRHADRFLDDLLSRPLSQERQTGDLLDREGTARIVFDIDGTREAARQRALPQTEELPPAFRRLDDLCAPGYTGRKRGEIVRTRTVISQAHTSQWLGSFGNRGNGLYRAELRQALFAIGRYLASHHLSQAQALLRFDGQYGTGAVIPTGYATR